MKLSCFLISSLELEGVEMRRKLNDFVVYNAHAFLLEHRDFCRASMGKSADRAISTDDTVARHFWSKRVFVECIADGPIALLAQCVGDFSIRGYFSCWDFLAKVIDLELEFSGHSSSRWGRCVLRRK